ncbi:hypothetical protein BDQ17DRAFT_1547961 [Cyathus striatus]|nr:hypothetical protein BDQ17DRAFT_1547961 [Cyathus striatus]
MYEPRPGIRADYIPVTEEHTGPYPSAYLPVPVRPRPSPCPESLLETTPSRVPTPIPECPVKHCQIPIDITVTSIDGTRFGSHKNTLQTCNDMLYQSALDNEGNGNAMPQTSTILSLLLCFAHVDEEQPDLRKLAFEIFEELAVEVEELKIEVARQACSLRMEAFAESNAFNVFKYATKYSYPTLSNKAAPHTINEPFAKMYKNVDSKTFALWVIYREEWAKSIRRLIATCPALLTNTNSLGKPHSNCSDIIRHFHNTVMRPVFQHGDGKAVVVPSNRIAAVSVVGNCADCREASVAWEKGIMEFSMRLFSTFTID